MESSASQLADPLEAVLVEAGLSSLEERFKREKVRSCIHSKFVLSRLGKSCDCPEIYSPECYVRGRGRPEGESVVL